MCALSARPRACMLARTHAQTFIEAVDAVDNGVSQWASSEPPLYVNNTTLGARVAALNPRWNEDSSEQTLYSRFLKAGGWAVQPGMYASMLVGGQEGGAAPCAFRDRSPCACFIHKARCVPYTWQCSGHGDACMLMVGGAGLNTWRRARREGHGSAGACAGAGRSHLLACSHGKTACARLLPCSGPDWVGVQGVCGVRVPGLAARPRVRQGGSLLLLLLLAVAWA